MQRHPGEVYFLPPEAREDGDPKTRRHVLLSACDDDSDIVALAYASTAGTEAAFGASYVLLDPYATQYQGTGFDQPTYIYPSRLVSVGVDALTKPVGIVVDEMQQIREKLRIALGLGTGTVAGTLLAAGSLRGRVVQFSASVLQETEAAYGLIVTEPRYSLQQRYQHVIPILDAGEYEPAAGDVVVTDTLWLREMGKFDSAILAVPMVFSVFHPVEVSRPLSVVVDDPTIAAVDEALIQLFGL
jgi:hypothetical protein